MSASIGAEAAAARTIRRLTRKTTITSIRTRAAAPNNCAKRSRGSNVAASSVSGSKACRTAAHETAARSPACSLLAMSLDHRLPPIDEVRNGHDGDEDQDQRDEARANPAATEHGRTRGALVQVFVEELCHVVTELMVASLEGLQAKLELPLLREGFREGADHASAVGQPACQWCEIFGLLVARPARPHAAAGENWNQTSVVAELTLERGNVLREIEPFLI